MNPQVKWVSLGLGAIILIALFILPAARKYAWAHRSVGTAAATTTDIPGTNSPGGDYGSQNAGDYRYGMMNWMMGPNWGGYQEGSSNAPQDNYPYWGMMGGYRGYPGQTGEPSQGQKYVGGAAATMELSIHPDSKLGPDGKKHDAYTPADFVVKQGTPVLVTIYNYDNTPHSFTSPSLDLNIQAAPAAADGSPGITRFSFTPAQTGNFAWQCVDPCDTQANGWAMSNDGYMLGTVQVKA